MKVEIHGGGFGNKGAELMLRTVVGWLREHDPNLEIAVEPKPKENYRQHAALTLTRIFPTTGIFPIRSLRYLFRSSLLRKAAFWSAKAGLPKSAYPILGLTDRKSCDALIDISGYAFGDKFPVAKTKNFRNLVEGYYRQDKPIVLMPQMFGPFENAQIRSAFKECFEMATLVFARDKSSFAAVKAIVGGEDQKLKLAPDITIFNSPKLSSSDPRTADYACIVPNERMLDQGGDQWGKTYLKRLADSARMMAKNNLNIVFLLHSADAGDRRIAEQLMTELATEIEPGKMSIFDNEHSLELKRFIAKSKFIVASRFHSVVAAFSTNVPAIVLGWAHKYRMLADDFDVPELIHESDMAPSELSNLVEQLCDDGNNETIRTRLKEAKSNMRSAADEMWYDIATLFHRKWPAFPVDREKTPS